VAKRHPNPRRIKRLRLYTVEELADVLELHKNTVRIWQKKLGLEPIDGRRPALFRGIDVIGFLQSRRSMSKRSCGPGELYCFKCRTPKIPAGQMADLVVERPSNGCLVGICPTCNTMLYRRINPSRIASFRGVLEIRIETAPTHIVDRDDTKLNSDSNTCERP
jgi:hypothetical protein